MKAKLKSARNPQANSQQTRLRWPLAMAALGLGTLPCAAMDLDKDLTLKVDVGVKETYDSNVFLQDNEPLSANVAAALAAGLRPVEASKGSLVTSILPKLVLDFKACPEFNLSLGYAPEIVDYHSASSEDYVTHRGTMNFTGKIGEATWELLNSVTYIDGSKEGPAFARPDDIPAIGGIPLRDRREAFIDRNSFRFTQPVGKWFFRPVASVYVHDFKTDQHANTHTALYSYENYIDRQEVSCGLDIGYEIFKDIHLVAGYRYGQQSQFKLLAAKSPYSNDYQRFLLGVEGKPTSWLKLAVLAGPDERDFQHRTPVGFDRNKNLYYLDFSATATPTKEDTVTLKSMRYEQPAFSSFSMYEDAKTDLSWKHQFTEQFAATLGFTLYIGDWQLPAKRNDWMYTPSLALNYAFDKHLSAEFAYSYDWVDSRISSTIERYTKSHEFTRSLASFGMKYSF